MRNIVLLFIFAVIALSPSPLHAVDDTFSCFDQFNGPVLKTFSGDNGYNSYKLMDWSTEFSRIDARGAIFRQEHTLGDGGTRPGGPMIVLGGAWRTEPRPTLCWVGGIFIGATPLSATFNDTKGNNGQGLSMNSNGGVLDGVRAYNIHEDAFKHTNGNNASRRPHKTKILRNSWIERTNGSFLENDHVANLTVDDVLIDGSFNGLSTDPGKNYNGDKSETNNTVTISNSLIRLLELPGSKVSSSLTVNYLIWIKPKKSVVPTFKIHNTIFATEGWTNHNGQSGRQQAAWDNIVECSNNTIAWLSDAPFPPPTFPMPPSHCFKIVKGKAARDLWAAAKKNWIDCHPKLGRVPGDPSSNPSQCDPNAYGGSEGGSGMPGSTTEG